MRVKPKGLSSGQAIAGHLLSSMSSPLVLLSLPSRLQDPFPKCASLLPPLSCSLFLLASFRDLLKCQLTAILPFLSRYIFDSPHFLSMLNIFPLSTLTPCGRCFLFSADSCIPKPGSRLSTQRPSSPYLLLIWLVGNG